MHDNQYISDFIVEKLRDHGFRVVYVGRFVLVKHDNIIICRLAFKDDFVSGMFGRRVCYCSPLFFDDIVSLVNEKNPGRLFRIEH